MEVVAAEIQRKAWQRLGCHPAITIIIVVSTVDEHDMTIMCSERTARGLHTTNI